MTDDKGFSINNESGSKHVLNLPWRLGVKHVINMAVFSMYVWSFELYLFLFCHRPTDILVEKIRKPKDIINVA